MNDDDGDVVKRIQIVYAGLQYSIGEQDYDQLKKTIEQAVTSGHPVWIRVNQGEGRPRAAELLITPSSSIALIAIDASGD